MARVNRIPICILLVISMLLGVVAAPVFAAKSFGKTSEKAIFIEAEDGKLDKDGRFVEEKNKDASGGAYITAPYSKDMQKVTDPDNTTPHAKISFEAPADGTYYIWMRYSNANGGTDSFFIGFNDDEINSEYGNAVAKATEDGLWNWQMVYTSSLKAGKNYIKLYPREPGLYFDAFYVTSDIAFEPEELAKIREEAEKKAEEAAKNRKVIPLDPVNKFDGKATMFEAEVSGSTGYVLVEDESDASGGKAVGTPKLPNGFNRERPELLDPPCISYTIDVPEDGTYYVWARMKADNNGMDTSWICYDVDKYVTVNTSTYGEYHWQKVLTGTLSKGIHTINIVTREIGMEFDNTEGYIPTSVKG